MFVSALFRSGSTHFCNELAGKLNLIFLDEIYDPLNDDILRMKRINHECTDVLKSLDKNRLGNLEFKKQIWYDHSRYLVNNHNYDIPWFEKADIFFCRRDFLGSLESMSRLISASKQPESNLWIYADWLRRYIEYVLTSLNSRPLFIAEDLGYTFKNNTSSASPQVIEIFNKKISTTLINEFDRRYLSKNTTWDSIAKEICGKSL